MRLINFIHNALLLPLRHSRQVMLSHDLSIIRYMYSISHFMKILDILNYRMYAYEILLGVRYISA